MPCLALGNVAACAKEKKKKEKKFGKGRGYLRILSKALFSCSRISMLLSVFWTGLDRTGQGKPTFA